MHGKQFWLWGVVMVLSMTLAAVGQTQPEGTLPPIDWGDFQEFFAVEKLTLGEIRWRDTLGELQKVTGLTFIAQAKDDFFLALPFIVRLYDAERIEITMSIVGFTPTSLDWRRGQRTRAAVLLGLSPAAFARVRSIVFARR